MWRGELARKLEGHADEVVADYLAGIALDLVVRVPGRMTVPRNGASSIWIWSATAVTPSQFTACKSVDANPDRCDHDLRKKGSKCAAFGS